MLPIESAAQGKVKLYRIVDGLESKEWCLGMIGSGGHTFCINKACKVKHRGGEKVSVEDTHLYVLKEPGVAFVAPTVNSLDVNTTLQENWLNETKSWNEWSKLFGMVKNLAAVTGLPGIGAGVSEDELIEQEAREARAETFRTPYKKRVRVEEENLVGEIPEMYSPVLKDDLAVSPDILASCLRKVETFVRDKFVSHESRFDQLEHAHDMGLTRMDSISQSIGNKPKKMRVEYDAPTVWTTISTIIDEFEKGMVTKVKEGIDQASALIPALVEKKVKEKVASINSLINQVKSLMVPNHVFETFLNDLKRKFILQDEQLTKIRQDIVSAQTTTPSSGFGDVLGLGTSGAYGGSRDNHGLNITNLENEVNALKNKIGCLEQGADRNEEPKDGRVKFAGLGF